LHDLRHRADFPVMPNVLQTGFACVASSAEFRALLTD